jgi:hypothetical protein
MCLIEKQKILLVQYIEFSPPPRQGNAILLQDFHTSQQFKYNTIDFRKGF